MPPFISIMVVKIVFNDSERIKEYDKAVLLVDVIRDCVPEFVFPCSCNGKCGKCIVKCNGVLSDITQAESELLGDRISDGLRLACFTKAVGDCTVIIDEISKLKNASEFDSVDKKAPLTGDNDCYAGVVDIGTTGVSAFVYKMPEMELVRAVSERNSQSVFGADVISRISYAMNNDSGELFKAITNQVDTLLSFDGKTVDFKVVTGNTAMLSLFRNVDVTPLSAAPFIPAELFGMNDGKICIPRCISAFVGADITCGIIASGMLNDEKSLLIDIGTNCEIVYKKRDKLICTSAAAGPAFECVNISNGVQSVEGAVNKVYNIGNRLEYTTIGRKKPIGICGSGLIDAVASMLRIGAVDETGYLETDYYIGDSGICITPDDIRNLQTAKASVRAAIETVCDDIAGLDKIYISGSFGSYLNLDSAIRIGLLPEEFKGKSTLCGNTAAHGAAMLLADKTLFALSSETAMKAETIQLAGNNDFFEKYINYINF